MPAFVRKRGFDGYYVAHTARNVGAKRNRTAVSAYGAEITRFHFGSDASRLKFTHDNPSAYFVEQYALNAAVKRTKPTLIGGSRLPMGHDVLAILEEFKFYAEGILRCTSKAIVTFKMEEGVDDAFHRRGLKNFFGCLINFHVAGKTFGLVTQRVEVGIERAVAKHHAHATFYAGRRFTENANVGVLFAS